MQTSPDSGRYDVDLTERSLAQLISSMRDVCACSRQLLLAVGRVVDQNPADLPASAYADLVGAYSRTSTALRLLDRARAALITPAPAATPAIADTPRNGADRP